MLCTVQYIHRDKLFALQKIPSVYEVRGILGRAWNFSFLERSFCRSRKKMPNHAEARGDLTGFLTESGEYASLIKQSTQGIHNTIRSFGFQKVSFQALKTRRDSSPYRP